MTIKMSNLNFFITFINIILSSVIGIYALNNWLKEKYNHEDMFLWGISFIFYSIKFIIILINNAFSVSNLPELINLLDIFIFGFQGQALLLNVIPCYKGCDNCKVCYKKHIRIGTWITMFPPIILFTAAIVHLCPPFINIVLITEVYITIILIGIISLLPSVAKMSILKLAFLGIIMSKLIKISNIIDFNYSDNILFQLETAFIAIGLILFIFAIKKN